MSNMKSGFGAICVFITCSAFGSALSLATNNTIRCRICSSAATLSDCVKMVTCDSTLEECYMDEIVTDALTIVYNGGCRSKDVCSLTGGKKRSHILAGCSRCCDFEDDCNKRLCGIKDDTLTASQCYSCDNRNSEQSAVKDPTRCVTLDTCQHNEVCYTTQSDIAGRDTFYYGCLSKLQCQILMKRAFDDYKVCVVNATQPSGGLTWKQTCGHFRRRSTSLCHSCCADSGCNYGTCHDQNENIFNLAMAGKFDMNTLKVV